MELNYTQFCTVEEFNSSMNLSGVPFLEAFQTSLGKFDNRQCTINLPKTTILLCERNAAYKQTLQNKKDFFTLIFPNSFRKPVINGTRVLKDSFYVFTPGEYMYGQFEKNTDTLAYFVDKNEICKLMGDEGMDRFFGLSKHNVAGQYQSKQAGLFRTYLLKALNMGNCIKMRDSTTAVNDLQDSLCLRIEKLCRDFDATWSKPSFGNQIRIINRATEYIRTSTNPNIRVLDLSNVACCTVRNLEYSFMHVLGVSPKKFITYRRFHLIHSELKSSDSSSVSNVLNKYGVTNAARFSQEYANYFGERPKVTLRKGIFA